MWTDAHCHLEQIGSSSTAIENALKSGVTKICAVSDSYESMQKVLELKNQFPDVVVAGFGLHPGLFEAFDDVIIDKSLAFFM